MSELKCCKRCGAFTTCTTKGECCPECEWFDPIDNLCMAIPETKIKPLKQTVEVKDDFDVDPDTFLFEDDDEDEDLSDLPPERESSEDSDDDIGIDDDADW
ncbi:MAG: hypothetical protein ACXABX_09080 [Candidatus Thorarchaeota archaeon]